MFALTTLVSTLTLLSLAAAQCDSQCAPTLKDGVSPCLRNRLGGPQATINQCIYAFQGDASRQVVCTGSLVQDDGQGDTTGGLITGLRGCFDDADGPKWGPAASPEPFTSITCPPSPVGGLALTYTRFVAPYLSCTYGPPVDDASPVCRYAWETSATPGALVAPNPDDAAASAAYFASTPCPATAPPAGLDFAELGHLDVLPRPSLAQQCSTLVCPAGINSNHKYPIGAIQTSDELLCVIQNSLGIISTCRYSLSTGLYAGAEAGDCPTVSAANGGGFAAAQVACPQPAVGVPGPTPPAGTAYHCPVPITVGYTAVAESLTADGALVCQYSQPFIAAPPERRLVKRQATTTTANEAVACTYSSANGALQTASGTSLCPQTATLLDANGNPVVVPSGGPSGSASASSAPSMSASGAPSVSASSMPSVSASDVPSASASSVPSGVPLGSGSGAQCGSQCASTLKDGVSPCLRSRLGGPNDDRPQCLYSVGGDPSAQAVCTYVDNGDGTEGLLAGARGCDGKQTDPLPTGPTTFKCPPSLPDLGALSTYSFGPSALVCRFEAGRCDFDYATGAPSASSTAGCPTTAPAADASFAVLGHEKCPAAVAPLDRCPVLTCPKGRATSGYVGDRGLPVGAVQCGGTLVCSSQATLAFFSISTCAYDLATGAFVSAENGVCPQNEDGTMAAATTACPVVENGIPGPTLTTGLSYGCPAPLLLGYTTVVATPVAGGLLCDYSGIVTEYPPLGRRARRARHHDLAIRQTTTTSEAASCAYAANGALIRSAGTTNCPRTAAVVDANGNPAAVPSGSAAPSGSASGVSSASASVAQSASSQSAAAPAASSAPIASDNAGRPSRSRSRSFGGDGGPTQTSRPCRDGCGSDDGGDDTGPHGPARGPQPSDTAGDHGSHGDEDDSGKHSGDAGSPDWTDASHGERPHADDDSDIGSHGVGSHGTGSSSDGAMHDHAHQGGRAHRSLSAGASGSGVSAHPRPTGVSFLHEDGGDAADGVGSDVAPDEPYNASADEAAVVDADEAVDGVETPETAGNDRSDDLDVDQTGEGPDSGESDAGEANAAATDAETSSGFTDGARVLPAAPSAPNSASRLGLSTLAVLGGVAALLF